MRSKSRWRSATRTSPRPRPSSAAPARRCWARAPLFPTVTAGAAVTRSKISANRSLNSTASLSRAPTTDFQLPVDLSYEVDVWGRIRRLIEASVASAQASAADLEAVRLSMHAELALDYFQLRGLD
ncbi:MAG TPA: hypothetical protein VHR45_24740, partial [Thermoanaerobaculia bacterium]|nr:hypothetical protein [Thermoanaerobaculia bacterium]